MQAVSTADGAVVLDQRWRRGGTFEGFARAWWEDHRFVAACPDPSDRAARIEAFERDDRFTLFWERRTVELRGGVCRITRRRMQATVYRRARA